MSDILLDEIYKLLDSGKSTSFRELVEQKKSELGINSDLQLAKLTGIDKNALPRIINGENQKVDLFSLIKICHFLGLDTTKVLQIYLASLKPEFIGELDIARKTNYILRTFDLDGLKKVGFIESTSDFQAIENRIVKFFDLDSIFQYSNEVGAVAFSRTKNTSHDKMREFWVRSAVFQFEKINNPNAYDSESLLSLIPKMAPYTRYVEKGFNHVRQALYNVGVTVIIQSYLSKTQVRGGTFVINNKPCIVVTDFNKSYPHLWFALMHELYHVLYDFEQLKKIKYHLTGEAQSDLFLFREDYADMFGWQMLFPKEKREYVKHVIKSENFVFNYAKENMVHPAIIYACYCEEKQTLEKKNEYGLYQQYFGKSEKAVQFVKCNPWNKESLTEEIEKIKKSLTVH